MSKILDDALEMYVRERIKNKPARDFGEAISAETKNFYDPCKKAGLERHSEQVITGVLLPFIDNVTKRLESWNEQV